MATSTKFTCKFDPAPCIAGLDAYAVKLLTNGRYAVQGGAQVIYDEARRLVPTKTGLLKSAIYQTYSKDNSIPGKTVFYHIGWNKRKAPHGHLIEYGHWTKHVGKYGPLKPHWVPAHPFLRPAFYAKVNIAIDVIKTKMGERLGGDQ